MEKKKDRDKETNQTLIEELKKKKPRASETQS